MLQKLNQFTSQILRVLLISIFVILTLDVLWGVFTRYGLGTQARWTEELARLLLVWLALLGSAFALKEKEHLALDALTRNWSGALQKWSQLIIQLFVLYFAAVFLFWGGLNLVHQRFSAGQMLPALDISKGWVYLALPVSGFLMIIFSLELVYKLASSQFSKRRPAE